MPQYYVLFWIPFLALVCYLYRRRSVWAIIILLSSAALYYRLPLLSGYDGRMFHIGLLCCLGISAFEGAIKKTRLRQESTDHIIWKSVFVYYCLIFISVALATYDRIPTKIYTLLDYSLLFFICLPCIKNRKDAVTLLKGVVFAIFLMGALGVIGYMFDDPWWGQMVYDDQGVQLARSDPFLSFAEKWRVSVGYNRGNAFAFLRTRVKSTADSPNGLGITMVLVLPLLMYFWFKTKSTCYKLLLAGLFALAITNITLAGSRTALVTFGVAFFIMAIGLTRTKLVRIRFFDYLLVFSLITCLAGSVISSQYFGRHIQKRIEKVSNVDSFMDAEGRMIRWKYAVESFKPSYLAIGWGHSSAPGRKGSHNTYLSTIHKAGVWACIAFCILLLRCMANSLRIEDRLMGLCFFAIVSAFAVSGITQESAMGIGPGYIFWPVAAILAKPQIFSSLAKDYEKKNRCFGNLL